MSKWTGWIPAGLLVTTMGLSGEIQAQMPTQKIGDEIAPSTVLRSSRKIDRLVEANLRRRGLEPNLKTDDATFVRRLYLDVVGRIPTAEETREFLGSDEKDKRGRLIDDLLDSPGSTSHTFNWWADLLRAKSRLPSNVSGEPYIHWIKESIAASKPYDEMVRELLTAEGPAHERGNGETGYYTRDRGMPLDNMANTMRIFLGTRLECAQCHNHPYEGWTQKQFYQMAAFTGGMQFRNLEAPNAREVRRRIEGDSAPVTTMGMGMGAEVGGTTPKPKGGNGPSVTLRAALRILQPLSFGIAGSGTGAIRLPKDYQYDDASPREVIRAETLFGEKAELDFEEMTQKGSKRDRRRARRGKSPAPRFRIKPIDSRAVFADWLTSDENPRFTTVIANRLWKSVMGVGLIEPVDDFRDDTKPSDPRLMKCLEEIIVDLSYDLRQFRRVLFNTETYHREASASQPEEGKPYYFEGPILRRMTAEQIWDSMLTLAVPDVDATIKSPEMKAERVYAQFDSLKVLTNEEIKERAEVQSLRYTDPEAFREKMRQRYASDRRQRGDEYRAERTRVASLRQSLAQARRQKNRKEQKRLQTELRDARKEVEERRKKRSMLGFLRASELPSPAPDGHFLRQFGQSDREQIQAAHRDATVPQALNLLNGFVEKRIIGNAYSTLLLALAEVKSPPEKVRTGYHGILNREPSEEELKMWLDELDKNGKETYGDLVWTLVNTHEFLFVQ